MRGIGDSTHPDSGYDMHTVASDLVELMTALGHDRFHICGEDWAPRPRTRCARGIRSAC
jgi:haloacetate dehalogenase